MNVDMSTGAAAFDRQQSSKASYEGGDAEGWENEATREMDPDYLQQYAAENDNCVVTETHLNEHFVNNNGQLLPMTDRREMRDYYNYRLAGTKRKQRDNAGVMSTFVIHAPKTLLDELPDYYPARKKGKQPRPRYVAKDKDEVRRYFADAVEVMARHVIPGGMAAVHSVHIHWDETTPHIHIFSDTFAGEYGALRNECSKAYWNHRDVRWPEGHPKAGKVVYRKDKMSAYRAAFRKDMYERGWPVELEPGDGGGLTREQYVALDEERRTMQADVQADAQVIVSGAKHYAEQIKSDAESDAEAIREQAHGVQRQLQVEQQRLLVIQAAHAQAQTDLEAAEKAAAEAEEHKQQVSAELTERMRQAKSAMDSAKSRHERLTAEILEKQKALVKGLSAETRAAVVEKVSTDVVSGDLSQVDAEFLRDFKASSQGSAYFSRYLEVRAAEEVDPTRVQRTLEDERAGQNRVQENAQENAQDFEL